MSFGRLLGAHCWGGREERGTLDPSLPPEPLVTVAAANSWGPCICHCAKKFTYTSSFYCHDGSICVLAPFYRWDNEGPAACLSHTGSGVGLRVQAQSCSLNTLPPPESWPPATLNEISPKMPLGFSTAARFLHLPRFTLPSLLTPLWRSRHVPYFYQIPHPSPGSGIVPTYLVVGQEFGRVASFLLTANPRSPLS